MKKKPTKKLILNKNTVAGLTADEMKHMKGASLINYCTDSCSVLQACCDPWFTKPETAQEDLG